MPHVLPELPYSKSALNPWMSTETLEFHHGKHHRGYVEKLNKLVADTPFENTPLEELIRTATGPLFNNAAQAWNHTFFWNCLTPEKNTSAQDLLSAIERDFIHIHLFQEKFKEEALKIFGSGWLWLVKTPDGKLSIYPTKDAGNPIRENLIPVLTCDLWEHAYYIDYRNERTEFVDAFFNLVNWEFAEQRFLSPTITLAA